MFHNISLDRGIGLGLAGLICLVGLGPLAIEAAQRRLDLFDLKNPFLVLYVLQLGASGAYTLISGTTAEYSLDPTTHAGDYELALLIALGGVAAFQAGIYSQPFRPIRVPSLLHGDWEVRRTAFIAVAGLAVGAVALALLIQVNGGLARYLLDREEIRNSGKLDGLGFLIFPATAVPAVCVLAFLAARRSRAHWQDAALIVVSALPGLLIGFRSLFLLPLAQGLVIWNYRVKKLSRRFVSLAILSMGTLSLAIAVTRGMDPALSVSQQVDLAEQMMEQGRLDVLTTGLFRQRGTEIVATVVNRIDRAGGYLLGWPAIYEASTIVIPRRVWSDKPEPLGVRFTTRFFGDDLAAARGIFDVDRWGGISPTVAGELYWHFGLPGVLFGLFLLGGIYRAVYTTLLANVDKPAVVLSYAVLFTSMTMFAEAIQGYLNGMVMYAILLAALIPALRGVTTSTAESAQRTQF